MRDPKERLRDILDAIARIEQQVEAARLSATISRNLEKLGHNDQ